MSFMDWLWPAQCLEYSDDFDIMNCKDCYLGPCLRHSFLLDSFNRVCRGFGYLWHERTNRNVNTYIDPTNQRQYYQNNRSQMVMNGCSLLRQMEWWNPKNLLRTYLRYNSESLGMRKRWISVPFLLLQLPPKEMYCSIIVEANEPALISPPLPWSPHRPPDWKGKKISDNIGLIVVWDGQNVKTIGIEWLF